MFKKNPPNKSCIVSSLFSVVFMKAVYNKISVVWGLNFGLLSVKVQYFYR